MGRACVHHGLTARSKPFSSRLLCDNMLNTISNASAIDSSPGAIGFFSGPPSHRHKVLQGPFQPEAPKSSCLGTGEAPPAPD
jgi:hypothetical protein